MPCEIKWEYGYDPDKPYSVSMVFGTDLAPGNSNLTAAQVEDLIEDAEFPSNINTLEKAAKVIAFILQAHVQADDIAYYRAVCRSTPFGSVDPDELAPSGVFGGINYNFGFDATSFALFRNTVAGLKFIVNGSYVARLFRVTGINDDTAGLLPDTPLDYAGGWTLVEPVPLMGLAKIDLLCGYLGVLAVSGVNVERSFRAMTSSGTFYKDFARS